VDNGKFELARWNLKDLLPAHAGPELERNLSELEQKVGAFEALRSKLDPALDVEEFYEMLEQYEDVYTRAVRLVAYAQLWFTEDTQAQEALGFLGRMDQITTDVQNRTLFFSLWWKSLEDDAAERLVKASGDYRYYLDSVRRFKPHTLSEAEEKVINTKDVNGMNAMLTLYSMITNKFSYALEVDGEKKTMTREELMAHTRHRDPNVRAAVYQELYDHVFKEHANELGQIYNYRVRDWYSENIQLRHHSSPLSVRNLSNDIPDEATDALLEVCRANVGHFQRYFQLKARWLGMEKLRRYDVYAPVVESDKRYEYAEAVDMVLQGVDSRRGENSRLAHSTAEHLAESVNAVDELSRCANERTDRGAEALREAERDGIERLCPT